MVTGACTEAEGAEAAGAGVAVGVAFCWANPTCSAVLFETLLPVTLPTTCATSACGPPARNARTVTAPAPMPASTIPTMTNATRNNNALDFILSNSLSSTPTTTPPDGFHRPRGGQLPPSEPGRGSETRQSLPPPGKSPSLPAGCYPCPTGRYEQ